MTSNDVQDQSAPDHTSASTVDETTAMDLPPSARFIVYVLEQHDGRIRRDELLEQTGIPESTLADALENLETAHIIQRTAASGDLRCTVIEFEE